MAYEVIEYYGQELTLAQIARIEGLIDITLARHYRRTKDIYKAVRQCKKVSRGKVGKIEYNGEQLSLYAIAQKSGTSYYALRETFPEETSDIYRAIKMCQEKKIEKELKQNQADEDGNKQEYYGHRMQLKEIAKFEGIDARLLRMYFKQVQEPYRAVFMAKHQTRANQKVNMGKITVSLYDLSILLGVKYSNLINLLNSGMTVNEIKEKYERQGETEKIKSQNRQILLEFCIKEKLDFSFMYRAIYTYRKNFLEAIQAAQENDKLIPRNWIFDKYSIILRKSRIPNLQSTAIMNEIQNSTISLEEAIEMCIARKNATQYDLPAAWGQSLYGLVQARKLLGDEFEAQISINENEKQFISACEYEIQELTSKLQVISSIFSNPDARDIKSGDSEQEL